MIASLRNDCEAIINEVIEKSLPENAVKNALSNFTRGKGKLILIAIGKAGFSMAKAAVDTIGAPDMGICITKYNHSHGIIPNVSVREAAHPIPDTNGFSATKEAVSMCQNLSSDDTVLFLVSGGGSALFEYPLIDEQTLMQITDSLLKSGADITEINTVRKHLSAVKGGRFAKICEPAKIKTIVLSDVLGDHLDVIASGPAYPDSTTGEDSLNILNKYGISVSDEIKKVLSVDTPKSLSNVETSIIGSVKLLCNVACDCAKRLGYFPVLLTDELTCEAREAGSFMGAIAKYQVSLGNHKVAFILGGETIVHVRGTGLGGRNQEMALAAAEGLSGKQAAFFALGSDGTDGPTDAAGGYVDGDSLKDFQKKNINVWEYLNNNDAYNALNAIDGLIITGPTGTNVNDVSVLLIK